MCFYVVSELNAFDDPGFHVFAGTRLTLTSSQERNCKESRLFNEHACINHDAMAFRCRLPMNMHV